ncbi:FAD-binding oxidoreductase [Pedobacter changchengzhani]|uniref:FAD-binding oxidoreductase n=1 Tax=Pedobacter changchengzhani TaxID=2529274 RepID=A0A4R5MP79_9SPHI|nr:FAD-binding oxidoreductase [Pedobacter changchengzhani]TDG37426.1 FAD-binding oxidoreductase [Pedobacter changchengzhani]
MKLALSYWETTTFFSYDIIVVGSGIVGLNTAISLKKSNSKLKICILESGFLPSGASTKNAGFACFGSISELIEQEKLAGEDGLSTLVKKRWLGLNKLRSILGDEQIDYQCLGGYELFKENEHLFAQECVSKIEHFNQLIGDIVGENAFKLAGEKINTFGFKGIGTLIDNKYEAQIDTGKMMFALIQYAQQLGIIIFNNCKVNKIGQEVDRISVHTEVGQFKCKKIALATNAFIKHLIPDLEIAPGRGQVLVTKPIKNLQINGTFHYDKGYYYFRNINDRLLLGGGRNLDFETENTPHFGETDKIQNALENLLHEIILPNVDFEIDQRWSGIMAFGKSLAPLIKQAKPNIFYATRCNGMGVAIGAQTGEDLANLVLESL